MRRPPRSVRPSRGGALLAALGLAALAACSPAGGPPSFLLFVFDTTRADHLSAFGYERETTPTLEGLAARGALFESAWAHSSLTPVSAGSFLTGALPFRHGVRSLLVVDESQELDPSLPTLFQVLADAGWRTGAFVSAAPMGHRYGFDRGFERFSDDFSAERARNRGLGNETQRRADSTTDEFLRWLDGVGPRRFAALVHYFDAHDATVVPPRAFLAERVSFPLPRNLDAVGNLVHWARNAAAEERIELYDAEIAYMDAEVRRVLEQLERDGRADETLVAMIADHGEGLGGHDFWTHGLLWQEQLHVPLLLAGPGVPRGARIGARVRLVDLFPTVTDLLGLEGAPRPPDGRSLAPLLAGEADAAPPQVVYSEVHHAVEDALTRDTEMYALVRWPWKYVHRPDVGAHELYDLASDPGETENLYREDHPEARRLAAALDALGAVGGYRASAAELGADERAILEDLGYLDRAGAAADDPR